MLDLHSLGVIVASVGSVIASIPIGMQVRKFQRWVRGIESVEVTRSTKRFSMDIRRGDGGDK